MVLLYNDLNKFKEEVHLMDSDEDNSENLNMIIYEHICVK